MKRRRSIILAALCVSLLFVTAVAQQDWDAIEAAAREEGQVVIYSVSSRMENILEPFMEKYGIEIIWYDIESSDQLEKFGREYDAGVYEVDVLYGNHSPEMENEFLPAGKVEAFVPSTVTHLLDPNEMNPFLVQRWSGRVLLYNVAQNPDGPPLDSLWDLTTEEWRGRVLTPDPIDGVQGHVYQTIIQHADEMAAAYEREFGEPIVLSPGVADAGHEWFLRFIQNDPVIIGSTSSIAKGITDITQTGLAPVGFTTFSRLRKYGVDPTGESQYAGAAAFDLDPVFGVAYPTILALSSQAPNPNAGKLLIRYLVETGYWPWNEIGDYASREDLEALQVSLFGIPPFDEVKLWVTDSNYVYNTLYQYSEFYLINAP